ncbi:MAG: protein-glutamate O-methyltransferase family protein [Gomphosphaeria aponina SAG 52.96 = DSM 107014]|uniref:Protein-glutamate O-methyltransferase family protein n=1 Tax=Gomphosphaeria aponina SAG 52.96 = DSM 107014 TaxID=1521640 RepID=A0A941GMY5_9CHRO|nr:protein-glutamate O-methyltransferase family protein [Gomphosphaeria aponina SAG 52.96 = DSM 107014]
MTKYLKKMANYPPPILVSELGSFAHKTLIERLPAIGKRIIIENDFPMLIRENLQILIDELPDGKVRAVLSQKCALDVVDWYRYIEPYLGESWLALPWYFAEAYFYRRVIEAIDYFNLVIDPYAGQKKLGLENSITSVYSLSSQINKLSGNWQKNELVNVIYAALWGNRFDLSLFSPEPEIQHKIYRENEQGNLLVDDTEKLVNWLAVNSVERIDVIIDNAGVELFCDLCLVDYLLNTQLAQTVCLHLKAHPTFVSDAIIKDVDDLLDRLFLEEDNEVKSFAMRLKKYITSQGLQLKEHLFWTSPLVFWEMPEDLMLELTKASLTIIKGDANYRRLLGDRHWSFTTPFAEIVSYFPTPLVALRTLKSEIVCGLQPSLITRLNTEDTHWLTNGKRGVIQFAC